MKKRTYTDKVCTVFLILDILYFLLILLIAGFLILAVKGREFGARQSETVQELQRKDEDLVLYLDGKEMRHIAEADLMFDPISYNEKKHRLDVSSDRSLKRDMMRTAYTGLFYEAEK